MWRPVLMINGFIVFVLGLMMLLPAGALYYYSGRFDYIFLQSSFTAMFFGGALFLANVGDIKKITILQGYLIPVTCWFLAPLVCALPLYGNGDIKTVYDAVFEATSGITSTGSTILQNIEAQPKSVLLWRAMLNGLGGIGIVIFAVALTPFLGTGGTHLFSKENSDTEEKFLPKIRYIAKDIIFVYIIFSIICAGLFKYAGMNWFDAVAFALSTMGTGGLSPKNTSIGYFDSPTIEAICAVFLLISALPITYFVLIFKRRSLSSIISNAQVNAFLKYVTCYILFISVFYTYNADIPFMTAFRQVSFNIISAVTTAGLASSDFISWGGWAVIVFLILFMHGGCTGSTTGSIKVFRWQVIAAFFKQYAIKALSPNQVTVMKTGDKVIGTEIVSSVFVLVFGFVFAITIYTLIICFSGVDFVTALGAVVANVTNSGLGLTAETGPAGSFAGFSPFVKYLLASAMVVGRLEVVTVFVLLNKLSRK
ncbi:MAG: TrkH family potassium uptake protein [Acetobacter sp.]|nr:TrkH family potassium uptake protein [Acetobacter sp.]